MSGRPPKPFGKMKKKPRGKQAAQKMKNKVMCSYCNKTLDGCPTVFSYTACKTFLDDFDRTHSCRPRHCDKCLCTRCMGSDTASETAAPAWSSTEGYSTSDDEIQHQLHHEIEHEKNDGTNYSPDHDTDSLPGLSDSETETDSADELSSDENCSTDPDFVPQECSMDSTMSDAFEPNITSNMNEFRIMNLEQLSKHVGEVTLHACLCEPARLLAAKGEAPVVLLGEVQRLGMASILHSTCQGCGQVFSFCSSPKVKGKGKERFEVNLRAVWAQMSTGGGCSRLNETAATLGMPGLQQCTFSDLENQIGDWWGEVLKAEMLEAGMEERRLAEQRNEYHEGIPAITVIIDGGWSKMAHKHSYNAPGGVGIVVGEETKKILFIRVKVKTCYICTRAENEGKVPEPHECFKNWSQSSQAMEAAIFLEAFNECEAVHGVRYMNVIGDGDSSTMPLLLTEGPSWCKDIVKKECANHSVKCLRAALERLVEEKPQYKGKGRLTKLKMIKITSGVRCAIKMRSEEEVKIGRAKAVKKLQHDIMNSMWHVSGYHDRCSSDFCKQKANDTSTPKDVQDGTAQTCNGTIENEEIGGGGEETAREGEEEEGEEEEEEEDLLEKLEEMWRNITNDEDLEASRTDCGSKDPLQGEMLYDISKLLQRLADKASRLMGNNTSNLAENWMSIRCKFDGGKKINRCQRGSWYNRCTGAGLRRNLGPEWAAITWERTTGRPASLPLWNFGKSQARALELSKKSKARPNVKRNARARKLRQQGQCNSKDAKKSYGAEVEELVAESDMSQSELDTKCKNFFENSVKVTAKNVSLIEKRTRLQSSCGVWRKEKACRLTSSNFGFVVRRNPKIAATTLIRKLLYSKFKGNSNTNHGLNQEPATKIDYEAIKSKETGKNVIVKQCGLYVCEDHPFLGSSPDGINTEDGKSVGLIEIKNVLRNKTITFEKQAAKAKSTFCLKLDENGKLYLNPKHEYFYQIQGQMNICDFEWVDFVVRSVCPYQIHIQRVYRDRSLWNETMLPKLKAFYFKAMLPELAAPRNGKLPGIREPGIWVC